MGTLKVFVNGKAVFTKSGTQGNKWNKADLKVQERATAVSTLFFNIYIIRPSFLMQ